MLSNYFTLLHAARLLHHRYARTVIAQVYSQEKNTLSILLYAPEPHTITISCTSRENYIIARAGDPRTQKNTVDLFPALIDMHIESVYISADDRIVYFKISGNMWLCVELFGSKANVLLCNDQNAVIDAFLHKHEVLSTSCNVQKFELPVSQSHILPDFETFKSVLTAFPNELKRPAQLLKKGIPKLGSLLAEEIIAETHPAGNIFTDEEIVRIYSASKTIIEDLLKLQHVTPVIYFEERSPVCFSLLPLRHCSSFSSETYEDLFVGMQKFISFERSTSSFLQKKKEIAAWLSKEMEKAERTIHAVEKEYTDSSRSSQYDLYANIIMAHLPAVSKGMKSISLPNTFTDNELVTIPLDPSLSPHKNAEKYFEKAKKSRSARAESQERLTQLRARIEMLKSILEKFNAVRESISLKNYLQSYGGMLKELGFMTEKEHEELPPFKIFSVEGGFTVFAGKNSANNDILTFKYAKPNDLWFHARGSSGSHVVLKIGSAQGTPTKKAIEQAASIAAYYSKMKNAKHVPVAMTEKKYIHKPKGAPAGTVALDKEKVIFVQPVLPENEV